MIIVLKPHTSKEDIDHIVEKITSLGLTPHLSEGEETTIIGVIGDERILQEEPLEAIAGVEKVMPVLKPYKRASREFNAKPTIVKAHGVNIGGKELVVMAGPCSVEAEDITLRIAREVKQRGAAVLRGGAFKPRTSPYAFQGMGEDGLKILALAREETGLAIVSEIMDVRDLDLMCRYVDILQIGARNAQNYNLLKEVGKANKPVLLKRGFAMTIEEWLMSAEYILASGNPNVALCERGIRTFETATRNTFDANAIAVIKQTSHLPIIADPSHATGKRALALPIAYAGIAAGADGVIVETHINPETATSDGAQTIDIPTFETMMGTLRKIADAVGRTLP